MNISKERFKKPFAVGDYLESLEASILSVEQANRNSVIYEIEWSCCGAVTKAKRSTLHRLHNEALRASGVAADNAKLCPDCKQARRTEMDRRRRAGSKEQCWKHTERDLMVRIAYFRKNQWPVPDMLKQYGPEQQYPTPYAQKSSIN